MTSSQERTGHISDVVEGGNTGQFPCIGLLEDTVMVTARLGEVCHDDGVSLTAREDEKADLIAIFLLLFSLVTYRLRQIVATRVTETRL